MGFAVRLVATRQILLTLSLGLAVGCADATGCDLCTSSVTVSGQVRDVAGTPLEHASVTLEPRVSGCDGSPLLVFDALTGNSPAPVVTDARGQYSIRLFSPMSPGGRCTLVTVVPPPGRGESITLQRSVTFEADWPKPSTAVTVIDVQLAR
jgi:hypothetical protein